MSEKTKPKIRVLFLCTGNSCRSQMAEGWVRHLKHEEMEPCSAGIDPIGVDPRAVQVMREVGVDISGQQSTHVSRYQGERFDFVVTLCDHARSSCPTFPGKMIHKPFDDPPVLAWSLAGEEERLAVYRRVRDEIRRFVEGMPENLEEEYREALAIKLA